MCNFLTSHILQWECVLSVFHNRHSQPSWIHALIRLFLLVIRSVSFMSEWQEWSETTLSVCYQCSCASVWINFNTGDFSFISLFFSPSHLSHISVADDLTILGGNGLRYIAELISVFVVGLLNLFCVLNVQWCFSCDCFTGIPHFDIFCLWMYSDGIQMFSILTLVQYLLFLLPKWPLKMPKQRFQIP